MTEDLEQTMRKEPVIQWFYAIIGLIPLAIGCFFIVPEYLLLTTRVVNILGFNVERSAPLRWIAIVFFLLIGAFFARVGIIMILHVYEQVRNRRIFKRGTTKTQAAILDRWCENDSNSYYVKLTYRIIDGMIEANPIDVVAEVGYGLYKKLENINQIPIRYAKEDPLIVTIEGEF